MMTRHFKIVAGCAAFRFKHVCMLAAVVAVTTGCIQVQPQADFARTQQITSDSTGVDRVFDPDAPLLSDEELEAIFQNGLTLREALEVVLTNNRGLHAAFASIGIAKADWVQSGLLSNPSLGLSLQFPEGGGRSNLQTSIAQSIVDFWQIPIKQRAAGHNLEEAVMRVARIASELAWETKRAYYEAVADSKLRGLAEENHRILEKSYEAIRAKREAGAASLLDENLARSEMLRGSLALGNAKTREHNSKVRLLGFLSMEPQAARFQLSNDLPEPLAESLNAEALVSLARDHRLDLKALSEVENAAHEAVELEYRSVFRDVSLGVALERPEDRASVGPGPRNREERQAQEIAEREEIKAILGPTLNVTLPIFDQNQAQIARAEYAHVRAVKSYQDLYFNVARDVCIALARSNRASTNTIFYQKELVPQAEEGLQFAQIAYKEGSANVIELLDAQRTLIEIRQGYLNSWLDAATMSVDLEQAVGLPTERMASAHAASSQPANHHEVGRHSATGK